MFIICVGMSSDVVLCDNCCCGLCAVFSMLYRRLSLRRRALVRSASLDDFADLRENSHLLLTTSKKELLSRSLQVLQLVQILTFSRAQFFLVDCEWLVQRVMLECDWWKNECLIA
jgi:hypothetical protein